MLTIRLAQLRVFSWMTWKGFEDRMVAHLERFFPESCNQLGEPKIREAIRTGTTKAGGYGIVSERDVCIFIDMMFEFGNDFDIDPELSWANQVLTDPTLKNPTIKVNRLFDAAMDYRKEGAKANG